jgi:NADH-quinone oxidoreductase subunit L
MTIPLLFLAFLTVVTGFIPFADLITTDGKPMEIHTVWEVAIPSVLVGLVGIAIATYMYRNPL